MLTPDDSAARHGSATAAVTTSDAISDLMPPESTIARSPRHAPGAAARTTDADPPRAIQRRLRPRSPRRPHLRRLARAAARQPLPRQPAPPPALAHHHRVVAAEL